jgi:hypothetical protein
MEALRLPPGMELRRGGADSRSAAPEAAFPFVENVLRPVPLTAGYDPFAGGEVVPLPSKVLALQQQQQNQTRVVAPCKYIS